jgi:hypothetical protein
MRRISLITGLLALLALATSASAITINSAVLQTRIFDDCPGSTLTTNNSYPSLISIEDINTPGCVGFANLHLWRFSSDGATVALFPNADGFRMCADLTITGNGAGESGLQISPWWDGNVEGRLNVRTTDGEIACFGGRLPFYSFTAPANGGLHYVKGTPIHLEMIYLPNGLSQASPGTLEYKVTYNSNNYTSGPLPFDEGNPLEGHGTWGILNDAHVGGHLQVFMGQSGQGNGLKADWANICYETLTVSVEPKTWSSVKGLFR